MDARKRSASIGALLVAALATSIAPASAATTTTRWVDGDGHAGPNGCNSSATAYKQIQKAVNASNEDDTVIVCPGTYRQQVRIRGDRDGLTLKSSTPFGATLLTPSSPTAVDGGVFLISVEQVDGVTVRGFKVLARTDGPCDDLDVGILVTGSRKAQVRGNRVMAPAAGARLVVRAGRSASQSPMMCSAARIRAAPARSSGTTRCATPPSAASSAPGSRAWSRCTPSTTRCGPTSARAHDRLRHRGPSAAASSVSGCWAVSRARSRNNVVQGSHVRAAGGPAWLFGIVVGDEFVMASGANGPIDVHDNIVRRVGYGMFDPVVRTSHHPCATRSPTPTRCRSWSEVDGQSAIRRNTIGAEGGIGLQGSSGQRRGLQHRVRCRAAHASTTAVAVRHRGHRQPLGRQHGDGREQPAWDLRATHLTHQECDRAPVVDSAGALRVRRVSSRSCRRAWNHPGRR